MTGFFFVGINPGTTGAMAILDDAGDPFQIIDYPGDPASLWKILSDDSIRTMDVRLCALEQAPIMPMERLGKDGNKKRQNPKSLAIFHQNYGIWLMAISIMAWPLELVHPMRWRKVLDSSVPAHPTKDDLLNFARRRWPGVDLHRKCDHNKAESLMIASYARLKYLGQFE